MFYARNGYDKDASEAAERVLKVVIETEKNENLEKIKAYSLMAAVKLNLKDYKNSIDWSEKA